jgi:hypothetical protein
MCKNSSSLIVLATLFSFGLFLPRQGSADSTPGLTLWDISFQNARFHQFSTLFTAHDVRQHLSTDEGLQKAAEWCKQTGITKVYVESFRDGYLAERAALRHATEAFQQARLVVSGCVTTTRVGKPSTGWKDVACCYTDRETQEKLRTIFEYTAGLFDEIMIDDFWFTDCTCPECDKARKAKTVTIGDHSYPVKGDSWEDYRCELMARLSHDQILEPAKRVNPRVKLIIKYPQWYDNFHMRGYDVLRETSEFDRIWVGTETRDYQDKKWGGTPQYEGYFIMRWLGGIGGKKCGGGWFDPLGTTAETYLEQARQTVLGGAHESMLFCYGSLLNGTGPQDVEKFRANLPELLKTAKEVGTRQIVGLAAYKPANSHPGTESRVFDFVGMLGLPLVPCHEFPTNAPAAFFSIHALKDDEFATKLGDFIHAGKPVLLTDGLAQSLTNRPGLDATNVHILKVNKDPKSLLDLSDAELQTLRAQLLQALNCSFKAPNRVALYLFQDKSYVVENFRDTAAPVELNGQALSVPARGWVYQWKQ